MQRKYRIIGACSGWGAQLRACEEGPEDLSISLENIKMLYPEKRAKDEEIPLSKSLPLIHHFNLQLAAEIKKALKEGFFPIVLGGDHSIAVGTWNAFPSPFGLIWIDAHLDAHTDKTTPSGAYHGMPVAGLLGYGLPEMTKLLKEQPTLMPQNLAFIGTRSFEAGEAALLKKLQVKIFAMKEVREKGLAKVVAEAIAHVTKSCAHYGVSLDLDVFSPEEAPGVGTPEEGGIGKEEFLPLCKTIGRDARLIGFELVEFNPQRDRSHKTRQLAYEILSEVMQ